MMNSGGGSGGNSSDEDEDLETQFKASLIHFVFV